MTVADVVVIGAGVVGLAVAHEAASRGRSVVVLERHELPGTEQSTHNSQVIHSGIFARPGTLRARLNVEGAARLFAAAEEWGVPVDRSGTMVVAGHDDHVPRLRRYESWGRENGVAGLERLSPDEARRYEPHLGPCREVLWSPNGGRIDAAGLVAALEREGHRRGVELRRGFSVASADRTSFGWVLRSESGDEVAGRSVVNSAGVESAGIARLFGSSRYRIYPCLGEYARVTNEKREWVRSMVYGFPAPGYAGIGVHLTRLLSGELLLGPTASYLESPQLPVRPITPLSEFLREAAPYLPGLTLEDLEPAGAGIRAKIVPPGSPEPFGDYLIEEDPPGSGVIHLVGIESPGLTSCLSVGRYVAEKLASIGSTASTGP